MIFVDTSAWFVLLVPWDRDHDAALAWFTANRKQLVTTAVIDETLTLLKARGEMARAITVAADMVNGSFAQLHVLTIDDLVAALTVFVRYADKRWSFTDCTSKLIIEKLEISQAFSFDRDLHRFGTVAVVP